MQFASLRAKSLLSQRITRGLIGALLGSASFAFAADPIAPPKVLSPVPSASHRSAEDCLPQFVMPAPAPTYKDLVQDSTITPPAPSPSSPAAASPADVVPSSPAQSFDFGGNFQSSTLLASSFVPSMIGDMGVVGGAVQAQATANITATGTTGTFNPLTSFGVDDPVNPTKIILYQNVNFNVTGVTPNGMGSISPFDFTPVQPISNFIDSNGNPIIANYSNIAVQNQSQVNAIVNNSITPTSNPPAPSSGQPNIQFQNGNVNLNLSGTPSNPQATATGVWNYTYDYIPIIAPGQSTANAAASMIPAGGGIAAAPSIALGRQKLSENASPIPRDRVFVNYSYFDNTPLTAGGVNVNRVTPGFEKTFLDGQMSFEMRTPFATTLDSTQNLTGITNTNETEFGNLTMYMKALLWTNEEWAFSTGMGVTVPTADDFVFLSNGSRVTVVDNQSVHVLPFFAGTYTPNNRFFSQAMMQIDVDVNGNPVSVSQYNGTNFTGALTQIGRPHDYTYMYLDFNMGYWVYLNQNSGALVTGIAPITELHLNQSIGGAGSAVGNVSGVNWAFLSNGAVSQLNGTVGMTAILRDRSTLTAAYCTPLTSEQAFDGEFRLSFNWFFGNSRPTNRLMRTSTF